jgi:pimeloyl-ACP methyl ester carboxylesterase
MKRVLPLLVWLIAFVSVRADEFSSGDVKIFYTTQGGGSPVLLIHGLLSSGALNWTLPGVTAALAKNHRVIVMDCRGHGKSGKPSTEADYGVKMVDDVIALLDHLDIRRVHLAGYSMGGMIAMKTAVLHPKRVQSLLVCGMGWLQEGGMQQAFWAGIAGRRGEGITACMNGMARLAVTQTEVKALKMPAAIIVGGKDIVDRLYVAPLEKIRRDWPVTRIAGAGHITCILNPAFREAVVSFENR